MPTATTGTSHYVVIGKIGRPHGLRGELRVFTEDPESQTLRQSQTLQLTLTSGAKRAVSIKKTNQTQRFWIVSFQGIQSRTEAEELVGATCAVQRSELPKEDDNEFYYCDFIGLSVRSPSGEDLGKVIELFHNGAHDVLVYGTSTHQCQMVPFTEEFVPEFDVDGGWMQVQPMEQNWT